MKLNLTKANEFIVTPSITAKEDNPFQIKFREPLEGDKSYLAPNNSEYYKDLLIKCFVGFVNKSTLEIELDGEPYDYFDFRTLISVAGSPEIEAIYQECLIEMIKVTSKQDEKVTETEKKSESHGNSIEAET